MPFPFLTLGLAAALLAVHHRHRLLAPQLAARVPSPAAAGLQPRALLAGRQYSRLGWSALVHERDADLRRSLAQLVVYGGLLEVLLQAGGGGIASGLLGMAALVTELHASSCLLYCGASKLLATHPLPPRLLLLRADASDLVIIDLPPALTDAAGWVYTYERDVASGFESVTLGMKWVATFSMMCAFHWWDWIPLYACLHYATCAVKKVLQRSGVLPGDPQPWEAENVQRRLLREACGPAAAVAAVVLHVYLLGPLGAVAFNLLLRPVVLAPLAAALRRTVRLVGGCAAVVGRVLLSSTHSGGDGANRNAVGGAVRSAAVKESKMAVADAGDEAAARPPSAQQHAGGCGSSSSQAASSSGVWPPVNVHAAHPQGATGESGIAVTCDRVVLHRPAPATRPLRHGEEASKLQALWRQLQDWWKLCPLLALLPKRSEADRCALSAAADGGSAASRAPTPSGCSKAAASTRTPASVGVAALSQRRCFAAAAAAHRRRGFVVAVGPRRPVGSVGGGRSSQ